MPTIRIPESQAGGGPAPVVPQGLEAGAAGDAALGRVITEGVTQISGSIAQVKAASELKDRKVEDLVERNERKRQIEADRAERKQEIEDAKAERELEKQQNKVDAQIRLTDNAELRIHRAQLDEDIDIAVQEMIDPGRESRFYDNLPPYEDVLEVIGNLTDERLERVLDTVESPDVLSVATAEFDLRRADTPSRRLAYARSKERFLIRQRERSTEAVVNMVAPLAGEGVDLFGNPEGISTERLALGIETIQLNNIGTDDNGGNAVAEYLENMRLQYADDPGQTLEFAIYAWNNVDEWMQLTPDAAASRKIGAFKEWAGAEVKSRVAEMLRAPTPDLKKIDVVSLTLDPGGEIAQFEENSARTLLLVEAGSQLGMISPEEAQGITHKIGEQLGAITLTRRVTQETMAAFANPAVRLDLTPEFSAAADMTWPILKAQLDAGTLEDRVQLVGSLLNTTKGNPFPKLAEYIQGLDLGDLEDRILGALTMLPYDMAFRDGPQSFQPGQTGWRSSGPVLTQEQRAVFGFMGDLMSGKKPMDPRTASALADTELESIRENFGNPNYAKIVADTLADDKTNPFSTAALTAEAKTRLDNDKINPVNSSHAHYLASVQRVAEAHYRRGMSPKAAISAGFAHAGNTHKLVGNHFEYLSADLRFEPAMVEADLREAVGQRIEQVRGKLPDREQIRLEPIPDRFNPTVPAGYFLLVEQRNVDNEAIESIVLMDDDGSPYVYQPSVETSLLHRNQLLIESVLGGDQVVSEDEFASAVQDPERAKRMSTSALAVEMVGVGRVTIGPAGRSPVSLPDTDFIVDLVPDSMIDEFDGVWRRQETNRPSGVLLTRDEIAAKLAATRGEEILESAGFQKGTGLYRFSKEGRDAYRKGYDRSISIQGVDVETEGLTVLDRLIPLAGENTGGGVRARAQTAGRQEVMKWITGSETWWIPETWDPGALDKVQELRVRQAVERVRILSAPITGSLIDTFGDLPAQLRAGQKARADQRQNIDTLIDILEEQAQRLDSAPTVRERMVNSKLKQIEQLEREIEAQRKENEELRLDREGTPFKLLLKEKEDRIRALKDEILEGAERLGGG